MNQCSLSQFILLLLLNLFTQQQEYRYAMESGFPFNNGRIYAIFNGHSISGTTVVTYYSRGIVDAPIGGITIGIRSLQMSDISCNKHDFLFFINTVTQTHFHLQSVISANFNINYTKIIVDYITSVNSSLDGGIISDTNFFPNGATSKTQSIYRGNPSFIADGDTKFEFFIIGLVITFQDLVFTIQSDNYILSPQQVVAVTTFPSQVNIQDLRLSYIAFNTRIFQNLYQNYNFTLDIITMSLDQDTYYLDFIPHFQTFISFQRANIPNFATKLDFNIEYPQQFNDPQFSYDNIYVSPLTSVNLFKSTNTVGQIFFHLLAYRKLNCRQLSEFPIIMVRSQLCFHQCPNYSYQINNQQCDYCQEIIEKCVECTNPSHAGIITCSKCDTNQNYFLYNNQCHFCDNNLFFNSTSLSCVLYCQDVLPGCLKCTIDASQCLQCQSVMSLSSGECTCADQQAYDQINKVCVGCNAIDYCTQCSFILGTLSCLNCSVNYQLISSDTCQQCNFNQVYNISSKICQNCNLISQCEVCIILGGLLSCSVCSVGLELIGVDCVPCNSNQVYNSTNQKCQSCSQLISNCSTCMILGGTTTCFTCQPNYQKVVNLCIMCNTSQGYDPLTLICTSCSIISNCVSCSSFGGTVTCISCLPNFQIDGNICKSCLLGYYSNGISECYQCSQQCIKCNSFLNCIECKTYVGIEFQLINGTCVDKKTLIYVKCSFSQFDVINNKCSSPQLISSLREGITYTASVPTINLISSYLSSFFALLDDLSYYSYHKRNYSRVISVYFVQLYNFTLFKWIPPQITSLYQKFNFTYSNIIMQHDLGKTPLDFVKNDGDIYFLKNTQKIWTSTLPFSFLSFLIFALLHWFSNKFIYKNKVLQKYDYIGMLIVSLVSSNIQYFSFKCAQQFFQIVPLAPIYYVNLIFCYIILFVIIVYTISSVFVFRTFYCYLSIRYVQKQLFDSFWVVRLITYNILKICAGFIHSYFYDSQYTQSILLLIVFTLKALFYLFTIQKNKQKLDYVVDMINLWLLVILQLLFHLQLVFITNDYYDNQIQSIMGNIENVIIFIVIGGKLFLICFLTLQESLIILMKFKKTKQVSKIKIQQTKTTTSSFRSSLIKSKKKISNQNQNNVPISKHLQKISKSKFSFQDKQYRYDNLLKNKNSYNKQFIEDSIQSLQISDKNTPNEVLIKRFNVFIKQTQNIC